MLITLLLPTSGTARVMGHDVVSETTEVRRRIGYVFGGDRGLYDRVSGPTTSGTSPSCTASTQRAAATDRALLEMVGLTGRDKEKVEGYSRGMRQRLHIARGLLHDPQVVFLDEPSIGLDPVGARELRQTVQALVDAGKTVLLTTHYMFEADALCDRIAVINDGPHRGARHRARPEGGRRQPHDRRDRDVRRHAEAVERVRARPRRRSRSTPRSATRRRSCWSRASTGAQITQRLLGLLGETRVGKVVAREPTLEDAYVHLIATTGDDERPPARHRLQAWPMSCARTAAPRLGRSPGSTCGCCWHPSSSC